MRRQACMASKHKKRFKGLKKSFPLEWLRVIVVMKTTRAGRPVR